MIIDVCYTIRAFVYKGVFKPGSMLSRTVATYPEVLMLPDRHLYLPDHPGYWMNYSNYSYHYIRKISKNELLLLVVKEKNEYFRDQLKILLKKIL